MSFAERAHHPDEVVKEKLKPDYKWYVNNQLVNPITRLLEYFPGIDMDRVAETLGMDKKKLNQNLEFREENTAVEDGASLLYNSDETAGSFINWNCSCGNKANIISMQNVTEQCSQCKNFVSGHSLQNSVSSVLKKYMDEYNKTLFSFSKNDDRSDQKKLPILNYMIEAEQETAIADLVSRTNTKLYNLEQLFKTDNRSSTRKVDENLQPIFLDCKREAEKIRGQSKFEWIRFGDICARVHADKISCRHYKIVQRQRDQLRNGN